MSKIFTKDELKRTEKKQQEDWFNNHTKKIFRFLNDTRRYFI